jgi:hypothetical protein
MARGVRSSLVSARNKVQAPAPIAPRPASPLAPSTDVAEVKATESAPPKQMAPVVVIPAPLPFQVTTPEPVPSPLAPTVSSELALLAAPAVEVEAAPASVPPLKTNIRDEEGATEAAVNEEAFRPRGFLTTLATFSEVIDPKLIQKMLPQTRARRRHLAKYVKGVVAVCAAVCLLAGVTAAVGSSGGGEAKAAPSRTAAISMEQRNGIARVELTKAVPSFDTKTDKTDKRLAVAAKPAKRR